ncbi:MAG: hypothetical protein O2887_11995 [Bacteroidetes bacterium]|nr:hypothetical protein [Bacteroidota bacterium]MDA1121193.1 hypothetical protein [Bacteroidota bacterium]
MKKLSNLILSFLALGLIVFAMSCGSDEPDPTAAFPTISITSSEFDDVTLTATGFPGDEVTATINISAEGGFNVMRISKTGGEAFTTIEELKASGTTPVTHSYSFSYVLLELEVGETVNFLIEAVDDLDQTKSETLTVITEAVPETPARIYSAILLAAPLEDKSSETYFSTSSGEIYSANSVISSTEAISTTIDFGYYYGLSSGAHLASPEAFLGVAGLDAQIDSWTVVNGITFKETDVTEAEFLEMDSWEDIDEIFEAATEITAPGNIAGLAIGV